VHRLYLYGFSRGQHPSATSIGQWTTWHRYLVADWLKSNRKVSIWRENDLVRSPTDANGHWQTCLNSLDETGASQLGPPIISLI